MDPFEDLLAYNPARDTSFLSVAHSDPAVLQSIFLYGSIADAVLRCHKCPPTANDDDGHWDSKSEIDTREVAYHVEGVLGVESTLGVSC